MYVCVRVCVYVCMYVCMDACMHLCVYACKYVDVLRVWLAKASYLGQLYVSNYKPSRHNSEARVHMSFYSHCCHRLHRRFRLQSGEP
jgi:hypothetical protein